MANDINNVLLIGRLTRDCSGNDYAFTQAGTARANISIAVNRSVKQHDGEKKDEVSFFDVTIWGKLAETLQPYLSKGKQIAVQGYLKQDRWNDQTGNSRSKVSIIAENIELLGGVNSNNTRDQTQSAYKPKPSAATPDMYSVPESNDEFPEEIPF